jgi:hypothetical protein
MRGTIPICLLAGFVAGPGAHADTWAAPTTRTYASKEDAFRLTVTPAPLGGQNGKCMGKLERQVKKGQ